LNTRSLGTIHISQKFTNRVTPSFMTVSEFLIKAESPFHRIKVWIRTLTKDYLLLEEEMPEDTCEFKIQFDSLFSAFNTSSVIEIILFDRNDRKVHATLEYADLQMPIIPYKSRKRIYMCRGPPCKYYRLLNKQLIFANNGSLEVCPDYT